MSSFCFAELRKRNLIYQKISAPVFAARGIERKFQPCFFRSLSDISFVIYSMQKINRDKKSLQNTLKAKKLFFYEDSAEDWHCEIPVFVCSFIQWVADQKAQGMPLHLLPCH